MSGLHEVYLQYTVVANVTMAVRVTKLLVNEGDSECHEAVVSNSKVHTADQVSEVRLVEEIYEELDAVSEVDYDEVCEIGEADE